MTDATELEEATLIAEELKNNPFNLEFDTVDVFGSTLNEAKTKYCCICGEPYEGYGNNPWPVKDDGRCCDACNLRFVIQSRIDLLDDSDRGE
jgi:hypothetical protein